MPLACFRCGGEKKSKLHTVYDDDWQRRLCNGCYGRLLSIYDVAQGTTPDDVRAETLGEQLLELVSLDDARGALRRQQYAAAAERHLSAPALRFLGTAEFVAEQLVGQESVEWSPAVIGLCKALEQEVTQRVLFPLRERVAAADLSDDSADKDLGRVARWCRGTTDAPPELGAVAHMLQTALNSQRRADTSVLLRALRVEASARPRAGWLLAPDGLASGLSDVTSRFRNPAAHVEILDATDYHACADAVVGEGGLLWRLVEATS
jgi:hypothetical protein